MKLLDDFKKSPALYKSSIICSRGCPFNCRFCSVTKMWGARCRFRSVESVITELKEMNTKYDITYVSFWDDTFTLNKRFVKRLCDSILKENLNLRWTCYSRVDTVSKNLLKLMKKAGCIAIFYGVESGSEKVLHIVGKKLILNEQRK
jgi:radical SAM superfamily enzyme YgiQ (UPF0313 family)